MIDMPARRSSLAAALCLVFSPLGLAMQQTPARDAGSAATGTASIRGRVTDAMTGESLHRVRLTLTGPSGPLVTISDNQGEFLFGQLQSGSYGLSAARAGYLSAEYGQTHPRLPGRRIDIGVGEAVRNAVISIFPGAMLSGRVTSSQGAAPMGALVEATELRVVNGQRVPVAVASVRTNDIGEFLISGLQPGSYVLRTSMPDSLSLTTAERQRLAFATTYYPGTTDARQAGAIALDVAQEVSRLQVPLLLVPPARIAGRVQNAHGEPLPSMTVGWTEVTRGADGALEERYAARRVEASADGAFEIPGLTAGEYVLRTALSSDEHASRRVVISGSDVTDVVLTLRPDSIVTGTVVADDGARLLFPPGNIRIVPIPSTSGDAFEPVPVSVRSDWTFRFPDLDGPHLFRVTGLPDGWNLKAVRAGGSDITEVPFEAAAVADNESRVDLVVTRRTSTVAGSIVDTRGQAAGGASIVVFSADPGTWGRASRTVRTTRARPDGRFAVTGLLPGRYLAVAREFLVDGEWEDPSWLLGLRAAAVEVDVADNQTAQVSVVLEAAR